MSQRDLNLHQLGVRFSNHYFKRAYGLRDEDLLPPKTPFKNADFAENDVYQTFENEISGSLKTDAGKRILDMVKDALPEI